jgi:hypothetical protein
LVLDVGGAGRPFVRADWVIDLRAYEQRGELGWDGDRSEERFDAETWVRRDICERTPWPFEDGQFDFAVCSQTLEDVRDPVWVSHELQRVALAGYIEVPTLREELTYGVQGPWVGYGHHHWLVLVGDGELEFVFKHHVVHRSGFHLPEGSEALLTPSQRVRGFWWEGSFAARERFMLSAAELDGFLQAIAGTGSRAFAQAPAQAPQPRRRRWTRRG